MHVHFRFNNSIHTHRSSDSAFFLYYYYSFCHTLLFYISHEFSLCINLSCRISLIHSLSYSRINYFIIITCNWFTTKWQLWQSWQDILYIVKSKKLFKISFTSTLHSYTQYETALMSFSDWSTYNNKKKRKWVWNVAWC